VPEDRDAGEVLGGSVGFLLSKLGMTSAMAFAAELQPLGIDPRHFGIMRIIASTEGRSQQQLGEAMRVPASRMVSLVDDLEERGLVERRRNPRDRRAHALHLTAKGRKLYDRALAVATGYEQRLCASLSDEERDQLLGLLQRLAHRADLPLGVHPTMVRPGPATPPGH
jgi:DNA-binding MarR family transcriptional regulator